MCFIFCGKWLSLGGRINNPRIILCRRRTFRLFRRHQISCIGANNNLVNKQWPSLTLSSHDWQSLDPPPLRPMNPSEVPCSVTSCSKNQEALVTLVVSMRLSWLDAPDRTQTQVRLPLLTPATAKRCRICVCEFQSSPRFTVMTAQQGHPDIQTESQMSSIALQWCIKIITLLNSSTQCVVED